MKTTIALSVMLLFLSSCLKDEGPEPVKRKQIQVVRYYDEKPVSNATVYFLKSESTSWDNFNDEVLESYSTDDQGKLMTPDIEWTGLVVEKPGFLRTSLGQNDYQSLMFNSTDNKVRIEQKVTYNVEVVNLIEETEYSTLNVYPDIVIQSDAPLNCVSGSVNTNSREEQFVGLARTSMGFRLVYDEGRETEITLYEFYPILPEGKNDFSFTY